MPGTEMSLGKRLNWLRRLFATSMGFLSFGIGGLAVGLVVVPWVRLRHRDEQARALALRRWISRGFRGHVNMLRILGALDFRWENPERLKGAKVVIANHPTLLDVVFLVGFIENAVCVVKEALLNNFFLGYAIRTAGYIGNADPETMIEQCASAIAGGATVVVFPEGTRSVPGQAPQLQRGAAYIALRAQAELTPVHISCVPSSLTKAEAWYEIPERMMQFELIVGEPMQIDAHQHKPRALGGRSVNEEIKRVLFEPPATERLNGTAGGSAASA